MNTKQQIPFHGIARFYKNHSEEILKISNRIYSSGQVLMGEDLDLFEKEIANCCDRKYAIAVGSCTDALFFALKANGIKPNDEVLVTSFSYIASASPILRAGAIPVFVDIDPNTLMMDMKDLENKITTRSKAIIAVHLFGEMLNVDALQEIAAKKKLIIIEDAAQALGCEWNSKKAGSIGTCSCISFDPTKIVGAFGSGGILLCDDYSISQSIRKLRFHGKNTETGQFENLGYNSRMGTVQAALINFQLQMLKEIIAKRNEIASLYEQKLSKIKCLKLPRPHTGNLHTYHKYVIQTDQRNSLKAYLDSKGITTLIHYPFLLPNLPLFERPTQKKENFQSANKAREEVLSLPIYPELCKEEIETICNTINSFFHS